MGIADVTVPAAALAPFFRVERGLPVGVNPLPDGDTGNAAPTPVRRAAFLDRDGVLIRPVVRDGLPYPVERVEDVQLMDGAADLCAALRRAGMLVVIVTNQPDVARGTATIADVEAINRRVCDRVEIDAVVACLHDDADDCLCRKPRPGMLTYVADLWDVALTSSVLVGDRWRDIEAGKRCGCHTVLVNHGYRERGPEDPPDLTVRTLAEAKSWILSTGGP